MRLVLRTTSHRDDAMLTATQTLSKSPVRLAIVFAVVALALVLAHALDATPAHAATGTAPNEHVARWCQSTAYAYYRVVIDRAAAAFRAARGQR
jgi:hypothetical protein